MDHSSSRLFSIGRAGDREFEGRRQFDGAVKGLRLMILDDLRLVENQSGPGKRGILREVQSEQRIGGHDDIGAPHQLRQVDPAAGRGLGDRDHPQSGSEFRAFRRPVADHTGRRHHQERLGIGAFEPRMADQGEGLHRLTQTHVVGEHAAESVVVQEREPVEAVLLIRPEGGLQRRGNPAVDDLVAGQQPADRLLPRRGLGGDDPDVLQFAEERRLKAAELQGPARVRPRSPWPLRSVAGASRTDRRPGRSRCRWAGS